LFQASSSGFNILAQPSSPMSVTGAAPGLIVEPIAGQQMAYATGPAAAYAPMVTTYAAPPAEQQVMYAAPTVTYAPS